MTIFFLECLVAIDFLYFALHSVIKDLRSARLKVWLLIVLLWFLSLPRKHKQIKTSSLHVSCT